VYNGEQFQLYTKISFYEPLLPISNWWCTLTKGKPTPSGLTLDLKFEEDGKVYIWQFMYSGIAGDAKDAGIEYGIHFTKESKEKEIDNIVLNCVVSLLNINPQNIITRQGVPHEQKEKNLRTFENLFGQFGFTDPRRMCSAPSVWKRPREIKLKCQKSDVRCINQSPQR
jgi:hypothetical protein